VCLPGSAEADEIPEVSPFVEGSVSRPVAAAPAPEAGSGLNVLILNSHLPVFPGGAGHEFLNTTNLARLARKVGLVSLIHSRDDLAKSRSFSEAGVRLYLWENPNLDAPQLAPARPTLRNRLHAHLETLFDSVAAWPSRPVDTMILDRCFRNVAPKLISAFSERHWHALIVIESSAAAMIDFVPRPLASVLVMHDIRSLVYERRASITHEARERRRLLRQARRYRRFEATYCQRYDLVVAVSQHDTDWIRDHYRPRRVLALPIPVDAAYFSPQPEIAQAPDRILFTGLLDHPPNEDAALFFARDVFPIIRASHPNAEFQVVGRTPTQDILALRDLPGVNVVFDVPDIRPFLAAAGVIVVPLRFGSGSRNKILEAWGMKKTVISTTIGAEGLEVNDGVNILIADGAPAFSSAVLRVLGDRSLGESLREPGRALIESDHDPKKIARRYYDAISETARARADETDRMRLVLDLRWMTPGLAGDLENLARSFVEDLFALDRTNEYTLILPVQCRYDFDLRRIPNVRVVSINSAGAAFEKRWAGLKRSLHSRLHLDFWESPEVLALQFVKRLNADIAYSFPGYIHPDLFPLRHVLVVPDIQHEYFPEFFEASALDERRRIYGDSIRRADHICAISSFTRWTLIDKLGVSAEKVTAIPLAADERFRPADRTDEDAHRLRVLDLVPGEYLYFPAHTWHHKNHYHAVTALRILRDRYGLKPVLACTGGAREAQPAIEKQVEASGLTSQVRFLGYVPRELVPTIYRGAAALFFPSLFEGFGMPVLEAMASGCPVVCSNTTSLPEIAGDAALQADPLDPEALAAALHQVLTNPVLRATMVERGTRQTARFSWRRHTVETLRILARVHSGLRGF
jgi:glycosyltransferase involved in cell wall biosynthesis